jgi:hypothetical protein
MAFCLPLRRRAAEGIAFVVTGRVSASFFAPNLKTPPYLSA